jgi:hypothetical protein
MASWVYWPQGGSAEERADDDPPGDERDADEDAVPDSAREPAPVT